MIDTRQGEGLRRQACCTTLRRCKAFGVWLTVVDTEAALETELPQACQRQQRGEAVRRHLCSNRPRS